MVSSAKKTLQDGGATANGSVKREATKRITVDLPRAEHKFLRDFAYDADSDGMKVMRALLAELQDDPKLSAKIQRRLLKIS